MPDDPGKQREHSYHAEATAMRGRLVLPYAAEIVPQAQAKFRGDKAGYKSQHAEPFRIEGIVSYNTAHTQAAGHLEPKTEKKAGAFKTLATAVVENLNILNVVTCDRMVAQVSTAHPLYVGIGDVPHVTFLGTQFHNLRIGGCLVEPILELQLVEKHSWKQAYTRLEAFKNHVRARLGISRQENRPAPADLQELDRCDPPEEAEECAEYSLVKGYRNELECPWKPDGNVFDIPDFGRIYLANVCIKHSKFQDGTDNPLLTDIELTMIRVEMGCIGTGQVSCCVGKTNGGPTPGIG